MSIELATPEGDAPVMLADLPATRLKMSLEATSRARDLGERWHRAFAQVGAETLSPEDQSRIAALMGVDPRTVRRKFRAWQGGERDAASLLDRRAVKQPRGTLDPDFIEYWQGLCATNGRASAPAYREFERQFLNGSPIPGIPAGMPRRRPLPRGYSLKNLMRHAPTPFELTAARIGPIAAAKCRPLVLTTRRELEVGMRYMFDDLWHDFEVAVLGQRGSRRLLQLHVHDVFSACQFLRGLKPRLEDPETGRSVQLRAGDMDFLTITALAKFGYHPAGTLLLLENGTATLGPQFLADLFEVTGGKVTAEFAAIQGAAAFAGQYPGRSKGNFRFKASLESSHNLGHNETANLLAFPGQTGANSRIDLPEELHGRKVQLDVLQRAMLSLPPEVVAELHLPVTPVEKVIWAVNEVWERINCRTEHDLEGWVEAGLTTVDYLIEAGVPLLSSARIQALPEAKRLALLSAATPIARRLSPREVFDGGRVRLIRLRPEQVARMLFRHASREVVVGRDHLIRLEDAEVSPSAMHFRALTLRPGDRFAAVLNPYAPDELHLFDAAGRWAGVAPIWQRVSLADPAALAAAVAESARDQALLLRQVAKQGAALTRRRIADQKHNARVLARHLATEDAVDEETRAAIRAMD